MISVIIPTHNKASILQTTLQRLVKQSYAELEIIVIDDGCSDETREIVQKFNYNIKYVQHHKQQGTISARNTGLKHATGSLIAFLDDDDLWNNNKLAIQKKIFDLHPQLDFVTISGAVFRPGKYALDESMNINDLINKAQGYLPEAHLDKANLTRTYMDGHTELINIDLEAFMSDTLQLQDWDHIHVYSIWDLYKKEHVKI